LGRITFITGTDTGVGKTVLTCLLLRHLRQQGVHALAMKPFCTGNRADVRLLAAAQDRALSAEEINPHFFRDPLAPWAACIKSGRRVVPGQVVEEVRSLAAKADHLLVEGVGGLLVPLTATWSVGDLIRQLDCEVVVVARNRLGTLNHTRLTVESLQRRGMQKLSVVLMNRRHRDGSAGSNRWILAALLAPTLVEEVPFLGLGWAAAGLWDRHAKKMKKTLARILGSAMLSPALRGTRQVARESA
jgi:dethiobiotin synthetase